MFGGRVVEKVIMIALELWPQYKYPASHNNKAVSAVSHSSRDVKPHNQEVGLPW